MPLADLVQALERDAAAQIRSLLDTASAHARALEAQAAHDREDRAMRAANACREECRASADERRAAAQQTARAEVLTERAAMLERVRTALLAQLPAYASRVKPALERAAKACAGDRPAVTREVPTGVVIELATGTQIVATLEALVEREWPRLSAAIVARINQENTS